MSHLEGAKVGASSRVGPFARLRPGTVLGEDGVLRGGEVLLRSDGRVTCVDCDCSDTAGAEGVTVVDHVLLRRLVSIAAVYAMRPRLLILDEPTAGLDWHDCRESGKMPCCKSASLDRGGRMARKILNRKELREQNDTAERSGEEKKPPGIDPAAG